MRSHRARLGQAMCVGDAQDAQDDAVRASASGRNFFFRDAIGRFGIMNPTPTPARQKATYTGLCRSAGPSGINRHLTFNVKEEALPKKLLHV